MIAVDGTTKDIEVVDSSRPYFEKPAMDALVKWRFRPQLESVVAVEKRGIQTVVDFESPA